jgi:hypothetical protein
MAKDLMSKEIKNQAKDAQMAWDDLRTSPAFPAIVGGLAGALGGAVLILIASQMRGTKKNEPAAYDSEGNPMNVVYLPPPKSFNLLGFAVGDLITLATIGAGLFQQIQAMRQTNQAQDMMAAVSDGSMLPPSPADLPKSKKKK